MALAQDIVFNCPNCKGAIIFELEHCGREAECPHCHKVMVLPSGTPVDKETFLEPHGLRRILQNVQNREKEETRRRMQDAKRRIAELEEKLAAAEKLLGEKDGAEKDVEKNQAASKEVVTLRKQLSDMSEKFVHANQAFQAGRKQHESALEKLRQDLEESREEAKSSKKDAGDSGQLRQQLEKEREERQELIAKLTQANADLEAARNEIAQLRSQVEAEQSKVTLMESAALEGAPKEPQPKGKEAKELRAQLEGLQEANEKLRGARNRAWHELETLRKQLAAHDAGDHVLHDLLAQVASTTQQALDQLERRSDVGAGKVSSEQ